MRPRVYAAAAIGISVALSACSRGPEAAAEKLVAQKITQASRGYLRLSKFTLLSITPAKGPGMDSYRVTYSVEAKALKDGGYVFLCAIYDKSSPLMGFQVRESPRKSDCFVYQSKKGQRYQFNRSRKENYKLSFAKKESGDWREVR